jgi:hypothetical protein
MGALEQPADGRHVTERSRRGRIAAAAGLVALAVASIGLFVVSRGKWSDALIDSGREWIVPDALARGDLLYRDVVYWFGPFTPYFHAAFFALLGSSFRTLVVAGVVGSIGVLAALYFALLNVTGRREAVLWTALAIPALVFMPNAGGPILGMGYRIWHAAAFVLAAIAVTSRPLASRPTLRPLAAGMFCALAGLCRTEWGLVSLLAVWVAAAVRSGWRRDLIREIAVACTGFAILFGAALGAFVLVAGWKAVIVDNHLLLTGLPPETREFLVAFSGIRDWRAGLAEIVYSAAMWLGLFVLVDLFAHWKSGPFELRKRIPSVAALLAVLGAAAALGGAGGAVIFSAAPAIALVGFVAGVLRGRGTAAAVLAGTGIAGVLLSYRRPFHIGDSAYVGPPLLFAFVCVAGLLRITVARKRSGIACSRLQNTLATATIALIVLSFGVRVATYLDDPRVAITGTDGMLSARPSVGGDLDAVARAVRRETREGEALVVFPEGEVLNHLSRRPNPLRHKLYIPGYLNETEEPVVLSELEDAKPTAVVIWNRPTGEYGRGMFGEDYGKRIGRWIRENYVKSSTAARNRSYVVYVRRASHR